MDKKPAARKRSHQDEDEPSAVTKLVQCLPREDLEHLISSSVVNKVPLTVEDLTKALPEGQKWKAKRRSKAEIGEGQSRVGTGLFDSVDDFIMQNILGYLHLQDRVVCCSKICKAWKTYKNLTGLWDDLTAFGPRSKQDKATCKSSRCRLRNSESWRVFYVLLNSHRLATTQIYAPNGS